MLLERLNCCFHSIKAQNSNTPFANMEASKKKKVKNNEEQDEDRLSNLTDEQIHHILSFLNTKYAVQTSVLSRRWSLIWKSLPYLDFNYYTFPYKTSLVSAEEEEEGEEDHDLKTRFFFDLIFQVIFMRHPFNLVKVRYTFPLVKRRGIAFLLICYAVEHKVQELEVNLCCSKPIKLPRSFYNCESLSVVKLNNGIKLPKHLALPALKSLHLDGFSLTEENFYPEIFSGCPNLETLKLVNVFIGNLKMLSIHALNLRNLELSISLEVSHSCKVVIHTPRLTSFKYVGYASVICSMDNLASLDQLYFDLHWDPCGPKEDDVFCVK